MHMSLSYLKANSVNRIFKGIVHGKLFHSTLYDLSLNLFFFLGVHLKVIHRSLFQELHGAESFLKSQYSFR
jgi:hypothetical protein